MPIRIGTRAVTAEFFDNPIPKPKKRKANQAELGLDDDEGHSTAQQQYHESLINQVRSAVDGWRKLPEGSWMVTPETEIWLTEVAPKVSSGKTTVMAMPIAWQTRNVARHAGN